MRNEIQVAGQQTGIKLRPYEHHAKYYETDQMGILYIIVGYEHRHIVKLSAFGLVNS